MLEIVQSHRLALPCFLLFWVFFPSCPSALVWLLRWCGQFYAFRCVQVRSLIFTCQSVKYAVNLDGGKWASWPLPPVSIVLFFLWGGKVGIGLVISGCAAYSGWKLL